jgi:GntR family transcriptional regulator, transcriptional repressor for pyruvate dehydrogenase complex
VDQFADAVESTRTFETAIEQIVEGIERASLRSGDRLPPERELAAQLSISVPTLRQALTVLARSGLLGARQGKGGGWFVVNDLVPVDAISAAVAVEEELAIETLRARRLVEACIARYVTVNGTDDDFAQLEWSMELLERHLDDRPSVMEADAAFHRALVRAAKSRPLREAMQPISRRLVAIRDAYGGVWHENRQTLDVHRRQVEAMRARDISALNEVLDEHLRMLEDAYARGLRRSPDELFAAVRSAW